MKDVPGFDQVVLLTVSEMIDLHVRSMGNRVVTDFILGPKGGYTSNKPSVRLLKTGTE